MINVDKLINYISQPWFLNLLLRQKTMAGMFRCLVDAINEVKEGNENE